MTNQQNKNTKASFHKQQSNFMPVHHSW